LATLKDIADALGLSPATVSRALNGFPEVNARTRARVEALARQMNYRPNQIAQKLVSGRSGMIGMILRSAQDAAADPSFFEVMTGLSQRLAEHEMDLVFHATPSSDLLAPYRRMVAKNILDGFILNAPTFDDPRIGWLTERGLPFVVHGRAGDGPLPYPYYDIDNAGAVTEATNLLMDLGHRRIALVNGPAEYAYARTRLSAFLKAMAARGLAVPSRFLTHDRLAEETGYRAALAALADPLPPSAFLCASTLIADGVMRALTDRGLQAPRDASVIAHDDAVPQMRSVSHAPALTVTRSPLRDACAPLADMMHAVLNGADPARLQTVVTADLILRASTGPTLEQTPWPLT
jgi:LacI family transcriptional regulator